MEDQTSIARLNQLHPAIRESALRAYRKAVKITPVGVHPVIVQTIRSFEEQDLLYQKGRTRPGPKVTDARAGQSYHNYGLAIDFCNAINGKLVWPKVPDRNWMIVVECFKEEGFKWGGDWKSFQDNPHFEKSFGLKEKELLARVKSGKVDSLGFVILT